MQVPCSHCEAPVSLDMEVCPQCGRERPTQAFLHAASGVRCMQQRRYRRALWELAAARAIVPDMPGLANWLSEAERAIEGGEGGPATRFVGDENMVVEELPWGPHDWLCRPDLVEADDLLLVRVHIPPGKAHQFHRHPEMEEIIYVLEGEAEQWVDRQQQQLGPGQSAHIPRDVVHGTYNTSSQTLRLLAILSPGKIDGPPLIDMKDEEPWKSLRPPMPEDG